MRNKKMGSAAPQKQQTLEDQYECYTVDSMPQDVKTRSKGADCIYPYLIVRYTVQLGVRHTTSCIYPYFLEYLHR